MKTNNLISKQMIRYFAIAVVIVIIELGVFQVVYLVGWNYIWGTILSFLVGVALNWPASRHLVFGASSFSKRRELSLIFIASLTGLAIQLGVGYVAVTMLSLYPLLGKVGSIGISFFWNYWFRQRFIFAKGVNRAEEIETSIF